MHGLGAVTWRYLTETGIEARSHGDYASCGYEHPEQGILSYEELLKEPDFERVFHLEEKEMPLHDPTAADASLRDWMKHLKLDVHAQEFALRFFSHQYLAEPEQIGIADLAHEERVYHQGDDDFYLPGGYDLLLARMAQRPRRAARRRRDRGRLVARARAGHDRRADHREAERVILTVPPPLLDGIRFAPELPEEKRRAALTLKTGPALKLYLQFTERFWDPRFNVYFTLGPISMWWEPGHGDRARRARADGAHRRAAGPLPQRAARGGHPHARAAGALPRCSGRAPRIGRSSRDHRSRG